MKKMLKGELKFCEKKFKGNKHLKSQYFSNFIDSIYKKWPKNK